jgi:hypothetical protein
MLWVRHVVGNKTKREKHQDEQTWDIHKKGTLIIKKQNKKIKIKKLTFSHQRNSL